MTPSATVSADLPRPVQEVLARLRWPATLDAHGMAAWGGAGPSQAGRVDAWVRWSGTEVEARGIRSQPGSPDQVIVARWRVSEAGQARFHFARDNSGPLLEECAWSDWSRLLEGLSSPMFMPARRRTPRP